MPVLRNPKISLKIFPLGMSIVGTLEGAIYQINEAAEMGKFQYDIVFLSDTEGRGNMINSKKFQEFLKSHGIRHLNLLGVLSRITENHRLGFDCDSHWNDDTHGYLAKTLVSELDL